MGARSLVGRFPGRVVPTLAVAGLLVFFLVAAIEDLPSRAEAEALVAERVAADDPTLDDVRCAEPKAAGFRCLLRLGDGGHGYALVSFREVSRVRGRVAAPDVTWEVVLDLNRVLNTSFELSPDEDVALRVQALALKAAGALTLDGPAQLGVTVSCEPLVVGGSDSCVTTGFLRRAELMRFTANQYAVTLLFDAPPIDIEKA